MEKSYSVHKVTVQTFRQALVSYLFSINREQDIPKIMSEFYDMDEYPGDRMPLDIVNKEFDLAVSFFQDEYIGLKVINYVDIRPLNLYRGLELVIAPFFKRNVEVPFIIICHLICRYSRLMTESLVIELTEIEGCLGLAFKPVLPAAICKHHIDSVVFAIHKIIKFFTQKNPVKLILSHRVSAHDLHLYRQYFSASAELTTEHTCLCYRPTLNVENNSHVDMSDEFKHFISNGFFINPLHHMFHEQFPQYSYAEQCQHILMTTMGVVHPTREQVAQVLNMSVSSLQRRLKEENVTFQEVLLNTRKKLAHKYLVEQKLSATYVASLLGYRSSSQFFTAFKSWFAMTPKSYKKMYS